MNTNGFDPRAWAFPAQFQNLTMAPMTAVTVLAKSSEPAMRAAVRGGLEVQGFLNRRVQALLEVPSKAAQCRTPQDVINAQMQFWQTAFQQYVETSQRVADVWAPAWAAMAPQAATGWWTALAAARSAAPERDLITFPEPKDTSLRDPAQPKPGERRAA